MKHLVLTKVTYDHETINIVKTLLISSIVIKQSFSTFKYFLGLPVVSFLVLFSLSCERGSTKIEDGFLGGVYLSQSKTNIVVGTRNLEIGSSTTVTLHLKDQNDEKFIPSNDFPVAVTFSFEDGTSTGTFSTVVDNKDGTFTAYLTAVSAGTASTVKATVNGKLLESVLPTITVVAGSSSLLPSIPTGLSGQAGQASISLNWTGVVSATSYNIYRGIISGALTQIASSTTTSFNDTTVTNGQTYFYALEAVNSFGASNRSAEISARAISSFTLVSATVSGANAISVSWNSATGASHYSVSYSTNNGGPYSNTGCATSSTSCLVSGLTAGTTYYFMVNATNAVGIGASVNANLQMSAVPIGAFSISGVATAGTSTTSGSVTLTFGSAAGASAYTVRYGTSSASYTSIATTNASSPYTVTNLTAGTTYYFMVNATNSYGSLSATNEVSQSPYRTFILDIPFTTGTISDYVVSSTSSVEFADHVVRLKMADQIDNADNSFNSSVFSGVVWNAASAVVRLNTTTNNSELDPSWTPKWNNLVTYLKFNGTGTVPSSGVSFTVDKGTTTCSALNSGNVYATGKLNQAMQLTEQNRLTCTGQEVSAIADNLTISGWIRASNIVSASTYAAIAYTNWDSVAGSSKGFAIQRNVNNSFVYLRVDTSVGQNATCTSNYMTALDGEWHHIAFTVNSISATSATIRGYMNGQLYRTCTFAYNAGGFGSPSNLYFRGAENTGFGGTTQFDEWAFWNTVLSDSEIKTIYSRQAPKFAGTLQSRVFDALSTGQIWTSVSTTTTLPFGKELPSQSISESSNHYNLMSSNLLTGNIGLWRFNETSAGTVSGSKDFADTSASGTTHLKGFGSLTYGVSSTTGRGLQLYTNAGTYNGYGIASMTALNTTQSYTVSTWVKSDDVSSTASNRTIVSKVGNSYPAFLLGYFGSGKAYRFTVYSNDSSPTSYSSIATVSATTGRWTHLVGVYDATTAKAQLYVDGKPQTAVTVAATFNATQNLMIGATIWNAVNNDFWPGVVDEVAIWDRVLTQNEILQLYRRYGNRIKYQLRSCTNADCSDQDSIALGNGWKGFDNTAYTYISESHNNSSLDTAGVGVGTVYPGNLNLIFSSLASSGLLVNANRYIQYRAFFESDDQNSLCVYGHCSPELQAFSFGPNHYSSQEQSVTTSASHLISQYRTLDASGTSVGFVETVGLNGCTSGARYSLSHNGTHFYFWNGSSWGLSDGTYVNGANSSSVIRTNISLFPAQVGSGTLYIRTHLKSNGTNPCEIDQVSVSGQKN